MDAHCSEAEADLVLRTLHEEAFQTWLSFSLQDQNEDLLKYLKSLDGTKGNDLEICLPPYMTLIPASVQAGDRKLYQLDVEIFCSGEE